MNSKSLLDTAKALLKAAKEKPEQFQDIKKTSAENLAPAANGQEAMKKDDMAHAPNTPEDKAHDVQEHTDSLQSAMALLDTPEKQKAMLEHLRSICEPSQERSADNQAAGQTTAEAQGAAPQMEKKEIIKLAKDLIKAAQDPKQFEEMKKAMAAPAKMAAPKAPAALPKPAASAAPAMPKAPKLAGAKMSKDEINADMATDWKPRFRKEKC